MAKKMVPPQGFPISPLNHTIQVYMSRPKVLPRRAIPGDSPDSEMTVKCRVYGKLKWWCNFIPVITHSCCISSSLSGVLGITNSSFSSPEASWDTSCLSMLLSSYRGAEGFSGVLGIVKLSLVSKLSLPLFTTLNGLRSLSPVTKLYV